MISTGSVICAILPFVRRYRPMLNRTLNIARRGSTNTVGCPNVGLNLLSLAVASSAVLFSAFSTSAIRLDPAESAGANRPRDPQIQDGLRLEASRASRLQEDALAALVQRDLRRRRPRLAAEVLKIRAQHHAGVRHVDRPHRAEHVRTIIGKPSVGIRQIVGIASERPITARSYSLERRRH